MIVKLSSIIKRGVFLLIFCFSFHANATKVLCPENKEFDPLMDKAIKLNSENKTKEAIATLQQLIDLAKSIGCEKGQLAATKNMMLVYAQVGDYKKSLEVSNAVVDLALIQKNYKTLSTLYKTRATLYDELGLYEQSLKNSEDAIKYAKLIPEDDLRHYELSFIYFNFSPYYQNRDDKKVLYYLEKSREEIQKVKDDSKDVPESKKVDMLISINMNLGTHYHDSKNKGRDIKLAEFYLMEGLKLLEGFKGQINPDTRIMYYEAVQELYKKKKEYEKSIEYGQKVLTLEKSNSLPYTRRVTYMVLAKSYLGIKDNETSQKYLELFSKLNDSINSAEKEAVEVPVKKIISETKTSSEKQIKNIIIISAVVILLLVICFLIYRRRSNRILHEKYQTLIDKLKAEQKEPLTEEIETEEETTDSAKSSYSISDETQKTLLKKLKRFENSDRYLKKDISIGWLSSQLNTNAKYLSEIINSHKNKNFSNYINGLRIDYITRKLYENPVYRDYKISYLAEECGYASSQVFVIAFKKETGVTPSYFIENLKMQFQLETENS